MRLRSSSPFRATPRSRSATHFCSTWYFRHAGFRYPRFVHLSPDPAVTRSVTHGPIRHARPSRSQAVTFVPIRHACTDRSRSSLSVTLVPIRHARPYPSQTVTHVPIRHARPNPSETVTFLPICHEPSRKHRPVTLVPMSQKVVVSLCSRHDTEHSTTNVVCKYYLSTFNPSNLLFFTCTHTHARGGSTMVLKH